MQQFLFALATTVSLAVTAVMAMTPDQYYRQQAVQRRGAFGALDITMTPCAFPAGRQPNWTTYATSLTPADGFTDSFMDHSMFFQTFSGRILRLASFINTASPALTPNNVSYTSWSAIFATIAEIGVLSPIATAPADFEVPDSSTKAQSLAILATGRFIQINSISMAYHLYVADATYLRVALVGGTVDFSGLRTLAGNSSSAVVDGNGAIARLSNKYLLTASYSLDQTVALVILISDRTARCVRRANIDDDTAPVANNTNVFFFAGLCSATQGTLSQPTVGAATATRFISPGAIVVGSAVTNTNTNPIVYVVDGTSFVIKLQSGVSSILSQMSAEYDVSLTVGIHVASYLGPSQSQPTQTLYIVSKHAPCDAVAVGTLTVNTYSLLQPASATVGYSTCAAGSPDRSPLRILWLQHNDTFMVTQSAQSQPLWTLSTCMGGTYPVPVPVPADSFSSMTFPPKNTTAVTANTSNQSTTMLATTNASMSSTTAPSGGGDDGKGRNTAVTVIAVLLAIVAVIGCAAAGVFLYRRHQKTKHRVPVSTSGGAGGEGGGVLRGGRAASDVYGADMKPQPAGTTGGDTTASDRDAIRDAI